jgi:glyoxylate/hydroxypyruvate reductase A
MTQSMAILFYSEVDSPEPWRRAFARALPEMPFRVWPEIGDPEAIRYALVWKPEAALLASLPRLAAILSLGAGVDHLLGNPGLPAGVPIVRLVDAGMGAEMGEYCLLGVLYFHRNLDEYARWQRQRVWKRLPGVRAADRRVGIMGLGVLGGGLAAKLVTLGFDVAGWSRTQKAVEGVACHWGAAGLEAFLARSEILVNLLPLTDATRGILNARTLDRLPDGACLINVARGAHLVDDDLLAALDSGKLRGAMLDVFQREPLAETHRFWTHPRILLTPHVAAPTIPELAVEQAIDAIRCFEDGRVPKGLVDCQRGY